MRPIGARSHSTARAATPSAGAPAAARLGTAASIRAGPRTGPRRAPLPSPASRHAPPPPETTPRGSAVQARAARGDRRSVTAAATPETPAAPPEPTPFAVVLLAGGVGKRMGAPMPKQYLNLRGRAVAAWSLATFLAMPEVTTVVIVCEPEWRGLFVEEALAEGARVVVGSAETDGSVRSDPAGAPGPGVEGGGEATASSVEVQELPGAAAGGSDPARARARVLFARPGRERQDSVASGLRALLGARDDRWQPSRDGGLVAVHDSARPLVAPGDVRRCVADARAHGAAVLGVRCKATVKRVGAGGLVAETLRRDELWEAQTPQIAAARLLLDASDEALARGDTLTDDVALLEARGLPVKLTEGSYANIKVTTPEDLGLAERLMEAAGQPVAATAAAPVAAATPVATP